MPSTYSINISMSTEAYRLSTVTASLYEIPDNIDKLVTPHNLRDAIYSIWENAIFKPVIGTAGIEYIGIDRDDIYNKIFLGKKNLSGTQIMDVSLLSSDTDVFFFNNKSDSNLSQQGTKISIIAGTNSLLYGKAPYIKTRTAINGSFSQVIQIDIGNNSGNLNLYSTTNRVYINGNATPSAIGWPTIAETSASASTNSILVYDSSTGNLSWNLNILATSSIGSPTISATVSILGNSVLINGYNIELNDSRPIINTVRSVKAGKTFSSDSIVETVREMLYSYIPPSCSLTVTPTFAEKGNISTPIIVGYSIHKRTDTVTSAIFTSGNVVGYSSPAPIVSPGSLLVSSPPYVLGVAPFGFFTTYVFSVQDSGVSNGYVPTIATASVSMSLTYPYFWGVSSVNTTNQSQVNSILSGLNKSVSTKSVKTPALSGTGYIYFIYPVSSGGPTYGLLSSIVDENGSTVSTSSYTYSIYIGPGLTSPSSYWSNIPYYVYKIGSVTGSTTTVGFPNPVTWTFNY